MPQVYKEPPPAGWKEAQPKDQAVRGKWWEIYNDPELNALEEQVNWYHRASAGKEGSSSVAAARASAVTPVVAATAQRGDIEPL